MLKIHQIYETMKPKKKNEKLSVIQAKLKNVIKHEDSYIQKDV